jgi:hypothetical protein
MKRFIATFVVAALVSMAWPAAAEQRSAPPGVEAAAFRQMAGAIPLGSRVKIRTTEGRRFTATLISATDEGIVLKREARVPEPAVEVRYDEVAALQRAGDKGGFSLGKAIGIGLAAGAGAILTLFAIAVSVSD